MKVFVTGATGYLGSALLQTLVNRGVPVKALCRQLPPDAHKEPVEWVKGDILDASTLTGAMQGCRQVYHCAGSAALFHAQPSVLYKINTLGTANVLQAARDAGVNRVVYTSSAGVLGRSLLTPLTENDVRLHPFDNDHDLSKHLAEEKAKEYARQGLEVIMVNPSILFGPGRKAQSNRVTQTIGQFLRQPYYLVPGNGEAVANYAFIDDVVDGLLRAMDLGCIGERYTLGGHNLSYNQLFSLLEEVSGLHRKRIQVPNLMMTLMAASGVGIHRLAGASPFITPRGVIRLTEHRVLSVEKARAELGYQVTEIQAALKLTVDYLAGKPAVLPYRKDLEIARA